MFSRASLYWLYTHGHKDETCNGSVAQEARYKVEILPKQLEYLFNLGSARTHPSIDDISHFFRIANNTGDAAHF